MKYLKKYKLLESVKDMLSDVKDILIDIEDDNGIELEYIPNGSYHKDAGGAPFPAIVIIIGDGDIFNLSKILPVLRRLESYVVRYGFKIDAELNDKYTSLIDFIEEYEDYDEEIYRMDLIIY